MIWISNLIDLQFFVIHTYICITKTLHYVILLADGHQVIRRKMKLHSWLPHKRRFVRSVYRIIRHYVTDCPSFQFAMLKHCITGEMCRISIPMDRKKLEYGLDLKSFVNNCFCHSLTCDNKSKQIIDFHLNSHFTYEERISYVNTKGVIWSVFGISISFLIYLLLFFCFQFSMTNSDQLGIQFKQNEWVPLFPTITIKEKCFSSFLLLQLNSMVFHSPLFWWKQHRNRSFEAVWCEEKKCSIRKIFTFPFNLIYFFSLSLDNNKQYIWNLN